MTTKHKELYRFILKANQFVIDSSYIDLIIRSCYGNKTFGIGDHQNKYSPITQIREMLKEDKVKI